MGYRPEWILGASVCVVAVLCAPPLVFALLFIAAMAALLAIAATPYLLFRSARRRWAHTERNSQ